MIEENEMTREQLREAGKEMLQSADLSPEKRREAIDMILKARLMDDPEANLIVAKMILGGSLKAGVSDQEGHALSLARHAANAGFSPARLFLDRYCRQRYRKQFPLFQNIPPSVPLTDFSGKPIKLHRQSRFSPVKGTLEYKDGQNILTVSVNAMFLYTDDIVDQDFFEDHVISGMKAWEGEYRIFGNQKLLVRVNITFEENWLGSLFIIPVSEDVSSMMKNVGKAIPSKKKRERITGLLDDRRSFAAAAFQRSLLSKRSIYIQSDDGSFSDYFTIAHTVKHEFGHSLGLGDLYENESESLSGVPKGTYPELDCYALTDRNYNLVMDDQFGLISNNDIEMVVLAFRENRVQLYQKQKIRGRISSALGRGN